MNALRALGLLLCLAVASTAAAQKREVTLLFTNDFESAYDPVNAFWREDIEHIGGIAQLAALINQIRRQDDNVFLFDAGDIFTGTLARYTQGAVSFELMMTMGYDAMAIGNHEFEYGWAELAQQKHRVPFPVLGANLFYRGTEHPFAQPYTIIERNGIRLGVIGMLGRDAATALIPSHIAGLEVRDPVTTTARYVELLRPQVDLVVVLTHQGMTAPMQTDDEADPTVQRGNAENLALARAVPGIDVIFAGHTDAGTREPLVEPKHGTLIMQTFGQGQHLGYLRLALNPSDGRPEVMSGQLLTVDSDAMQPEPRVMQKLTDFRARFPKLYEPAGRTTRHLARRYYLESDLGNLFADIVRSATDADVGLMPSGALRKDLPAGMVRRVDLLDAFPFEDRIASVTLTGAQLKAVLEQGLSLERGILQVSGVRACYDPAAKPGARLVEVQVNGEPLQEDRLYTAGTLEILAQGGDAYTQFRQTEALLLPEAFADTLQKFFANQELVDIPARGRLLALDNKQDAARCPF